MFLARRYCRFLLLPFLAVILILASAFPAVVLADDEVPPPGPTPLATDTPGVAPIDEDANGSASGDALTDSESADSVQNGVEVGISEDDPRISADGEMSPNVLTTTLPIWCPDGAEPIAGQNGCTAEFGSISLLMDYLNSNSVGDQGQIWISASSSSEDVEISAENSPAMGEGMVADASDNEGGVKIVILDYAGNSLQLDGEQATNALLDGQPVWCPDGIAPADGGESCTGSAGSLGLLVSMIDNGSLEDGAIYVQAPASDALVAENASPHIEQANESFAEDEQNITQAAQSLVNGDNSSSAAILHDPIWCPNGLPPDPGNGGCTAAQPDLLTLIGVLSGIEATLVDGTIWIQDGNDTSAASISINGGSYTTWQSRSLTFNGGWIGTAGDPSIVGNTTFAQSISVIGWQNDVSVNNVVIQGGATGDGLTIQTTGDVSLDTITSNNNSTGYGVNIASTGGAVSAQNTTTNFNRVGIRADNSVIAVAQPVTFTNIIANANTPGAGLVILSLGDISVDTVSASGNGGRGIVLDNNAGSGGIDVQNVNVTASTANGMSVNSSAGIVVACSAFNSSSPFFGIDASNFATLQINGVTFSGTGGTYTTSGPGVVSLDPSCTPSSGGGGGGGSAGNNTFINTLNSSGSSGQSSLNIVNVPTANGSNSVELNCVDFSGTQLSLPNGDRVIYQCPTTGEASLVRVDNAEASLPGALPGNVVFMSAMQTYLTNGGIEQSLTSGDLQISFIIPVDMIGFDVAILVWDGSIWSDLSAATFTDGRLVFGGGIKTEDGRFEATTNFPGIFVLVRK